MDTATESSLDSEIRSTLTATTLYSGVSVTLSRCGLVIWFKKTSAAWNVAKSSPSSIKGDPSYGENSALYASLGYVRKDDRKSGLTRAAKAEDKKAA